MSPPLTRRSLRWSDLAVAMCFTVGCATTPRNPVLDQYPSGVIGRTTVEYYDVHGRTIAEWERFIGALEAHEAGHKNIAAKAAHDIAERLRGLSTLCSQISSRTSDLGREILEKANGQQKAYDAETHHGLTQGTAFGAGRFGSAGFGGAPDRLVLLAAPRAGTVRGILPNSLESAWIALPTAYAAVGLTTNVIDSTTHAIGDSLTVRGKIAGTPLSEVVDCDVPPSGRAADSVAVRTPTPSAGSPER